jgi:hypothetical protein
MTIPVLRRAFEHIEQLVDGKLRKRMDKAHIIPALQKEWRTVFFKHLPKVSAEEFIAERTQHLEKEKEGHRTLRRSGGAELDGAPIDYNLRAGVYLAPGSLPSSSGAYGSYADYVAGGFHNPQIARGYDPIAGQSMVLKGGKRSKTRSAIKGKKVNTRKLRRSGGGIVDSAMTMLDQISMRPFPLAVPSTIPNDLQAMAKGQYVGPSPDQIQRMPSYHMETLYPKPVTFSK